VQGTRKEVRDRENVLDLGFGGAVNIFAKKDSRLVEIRGLARGITKVMHNTLDGRGLIDSGSTTQDEVICKEQRVDGGQPGPRLILERLALLSSVWRQMESSFIATTKR
jgi:hypothetical protein